MERIEQNPDTQAELHFRQSEPNKVADVVGSRNFNNGMDRSGEQYVVVDRQIAEANKAYIGKLARQLTAKAGFTVPRGQPGPVSQLHSSSNES